MKNCFSILLILLLSLVLDGSAGESKAAVELSWKFDNGSLGEWKVDDNGEILLSHAPRSGEIWYYFRLDKVANKTRTFVFPNARSDFYGGDSLPFISYDQTFWTTIKNRSIAPNPNEPGRVRYTFTHTFITDRAWIAYTPPFTNRILDKLTAEISPHPHVAVQTLCETPIKQLPLTLISITDPETKDEDKKSAVILAREDAYETAGSWVAEGLIRFLLSDDPVAAAIKRRLIVHVVPLFDPDGVALGHAIHPLSENGDNVYWTETWPESAYSFYEQRQFKRFFQDWKDKGLNVDYSLRLHSSGWSGDSLRREHCSKENQPAQDTLFNDLAGTKYMPWHTSLDRLLRKTRFSKFIADLFPNAITGFCQSEWIYSNAFGLPYPLYKTRDDLLLEGELLIRAIGERLGVSGSDPPPCLHAAEFYRLVGKTGEMYHVRCVYRDLLGRPAQYVRVLVNGKPYDLKPVSENGKAPDSQTGILYTGFLTMEDEINNHVFVTSNGSREFKTPASAPRTGPLMPAKPKRKK